MEITPCTVELKQIWRLWSACASPYIRSTVRSILFSICCRPLQTWNICTSSLARWPSSNSTRCWVSCRHSNRYAWNWNFPRLTRCLTRLRHRPRSNPFHSHLHPEGCIWPTGLAPRSSRFCVLSDGWPALRALTSVGATTFIHQTITLMRWHPCWVRISRRTTTTTGMIMPHQSSSHWRLCFGHVMPCSVDGYLGHQTEFFKTEYCSF